MAAVPGDAALPCGTSVRAGGGEGCGLSARRRFGDSQRVC